ncbi:hypothetical protein A3765_28595 [Oleiphilus sp. HI0130]|nr:hypothetical protein A3765_28880 [Oleiphilus sp. HI0130]KZZ72512.1 hypothetical protein A3765_28595 [Oleiphilus sp. HI0130]
MKSNKIRASAKGEECTFQIVGVCNYNPETTVLCHLNFELSGMGRKASDLSAAYGCSACHDAIDGRIDSFELEEDRWFYLGRALYRTQERLHEKQILNVA